MATEGHFTLQARFDVARLDLIVDPHRFTCRTPHLDSSNAHDWHLARAAGRPRHGSLTLTNKLENFGACTDECVSSLEESIVHLGIPTVLILS